MAPVYRCQWVRYSPQPDVEPGLGYDAEMDDREAHRLVYDLERLDGAEGIYRPNLEALIADLMERTFKSTDQAETVRLAHVEMRARTILKRWKGRNLNGAPLSPPPRTSSPAPSSAAQASAR